MNGFYSCLIAVSMYSRLPVPQVQWTEERMRRVMSFFPVVGLIEGILFGGWLFLSQNCFGFSRMTSVLWGAAIPLMVTGGIHMDGFMDTMDALCSWGDREKKLQILKDPHLGAFAVIAALGYSFLYVGALYQLCETIQETSRFWAYSLPAAFLVTERAFSGLSVVSFPSAKKDGLAAAFAKAAAKKKDRRILFLWLIFIPLIFAGIFGKKGLLAVAGLECMQFLLFGGYYIKSKKEFGGVTGDLAGFFLQVCELAALMALAVFLRYL